MSKSAAITNSILAAGPIILAVIGGAIAAFPGSPLSLFGIALMILGCVLIIRAKWPQIKTGEWNKFGIPKSFSVHKNIYIAGYFCIVIGFLSILVARFQ